MRQITRSRNIRGKFPNKVIRPIPIPVPKIDYNKYSDLGYIHNGDFGDIVYFLPAMQYRPGKLYISNITSLGTRQKLNAELFAPLARLLETQSYVKGIEEHKGQDAIDANRWRTGYSSHINLAEWQMKLLDVPLNVINEPWLKVPKNRVAAHVVNRTTRYHGRFPINEVGKDAVFIGTEKEWKLFCIEFRPIPYYYTKDLLEAAMVIAGADLFIGNQSCCFAICEGLKQNAVLEVFLGSPNCCFNRPNVKFLKEWS
jgi:hypothetical protein